MNMTLKQIKAKLELAGYTMEVDNREAILYTPVNKKTGRDSAACELSWTMEVMSTCCGVNELGEFYLDIYLSGEHKAKVNLFIQYVFLTLKYIGEKNKRKGLVFVSNGRNGWDLVEKALEGLKSEFILASTTINPSTKNKLKLYVAKF